MENRTETLNLAVLGPLRIEANGKAVTPPRSPILRGLLGVLLVAADRPLTATQLIDLIWMDRSETVGPGAVQVGVSRLRRWLRSLGATPERGWRLAHDGVGYRLAAPAEAVDLTRFRYMVEQAGAEKDIERQSSTLAAAMTLWRGPVLMDQPMVDLSSPLLRAVEDEVRTAGLDLAMACRAAGRPAAALDALTALTAAYPLHEELQASLIETLGADGRVAEALRSYRLFRERVVEELGVEPGERVYGAYLSTLARDSPKEPVPAGLGIAARPAQLPPGIPDFTAREQQVAELSRTLSDRRTARVAVISGMGGVGKTTLAVHVGHALAERFPDGQLYAKLRDPEGVPLDTAQVLNRFLLALGLEGREIPETLESRVSLYRSILARRNVLVLLDDAPGEQYVRPLLPGAAGCATLVTSRVPLTGLEGATLTHLEVFDPAQAIELLARIAGRDRVVAEPEAAAEVVRLCAYMPLAVRIAAARLAGRRHWTLARLATRLQDERRRLDELAVGDLAVRSCFTLSYIRLTAEARRLFRLLGLLWAPDFGDWVAGALLDIPFEAGAAYLEDLVDTRLITVAGTDDTGRLRYRFHDLARLYARERADVDEDAGNRTAAVRRALGGWLWLAERAAGLVPGPCYATIHGSATRTSLPQPLADELLAAPTAWFDAERFALSAAVEQACALGMDEMAWELAAAQEKYLDVRGLASDWRRMHEKALPLCRKAGNRKGEAVLLRGLLEINTWMPGDRADEAMISLYEQSVHLQRLFAEIGEWRGVADALVMQCWGLNAMGERAQGLERGEEALRLAQENDHLGGEARAHHVMAIAHGERQIEPAVDHLERCLHLARLQGNPRFEATAMQFLGAAHCMAGRIESGHDLLVRSLRICHSYRDHYAAAFSLLYLGKLYTALGDQRARPTIETVVSISTRHHMDHHAADALKVLGELDLASGDYATATEHLQESVRLWRTRGWREFLADALRTLGRAYSGTGDEESARKVWGEALELFRRLGDDGAVAELSALLGESLPEGMPANQPE
ncbi:BTAD domain-containing putative transcriptional regulator [Actinomadura sp. NBRC 104412]|uniref:AfsR/SARP family transcriptional regulator n=1 Tax=Actinomadura sp. NBRC 104412 TaxID=3032203 RepID=UPI00255523EA|nr:BTAD domain-containing putative transcriptional regulator [Actinomadura sp. NBRC 104412]